MIFRLFYLFGVLGVLLVCGWMLQGFLQLNQDAMKLQPTISAMQAQAANATAVIIDAQGNYINNAAQATAVIVSSQGQYAVDIARATQIVADSNQGPVNIYLAGVDEGNNQAQQKAGIFGAGFGLGSITLVVIGFILFLVYAATR